LRLLARHPKVLVEDPEAWFFEVTNDLEHDPKVSKLTKELVNLFAGAVAQAHQEQ
jgi:hypothetical protein